MIGWRIVEAIADDFIKQVGVVCVHLINKVRSEIKKIGIARRKQRAVFFPKTRFAYIVHKFLPFENVRKYPAVESCVRIVKTAGRNYEKHNGFFVDDLNFVGFGGEGVKTKPLRDRRVFTPLAQRSTPEVLPWVWARSTGANGVSPGRRRNCAHSVTNSRKWYGVGRRPVEISYQTVKRVCPIIRKKQSVV